jgi:hypothetical protein
MAQSQPLREVLKNCSEGDLLICTCAFSTSNFFTDKTYQVIRGENNRQGKLCVIDAKGMEITRAVSEFKYVKTHPTGSTLGRVQR